MSIRYPGGKGAAGVFQTLVNLIPPHDVYIETHLGGGTMMARKLPARVNIGIDVDSITLAAWEKEYPGRGDVLLLCRSAHDFLRDYEFTGSEFIYADPPYLMETRSCKQPLYRHEYTDADHYELLTLLMALPCQVMLSGYWSKFYENMLRGWERRDYQSMTRRGVRTESVWINYTPPMYRTTPAISGPTIGRASR
jgi:site-specific DNA-adenine methylase